MRLQTILIALFILITQHSIGQGKILLFGGEENDEGRDLIKCKDGGYLLAGSTSSFGMGKSDIYLVKINENLDSIHWTTTLGYEQIDWAYAIQETFDNGFVIAGYSNSMSENGYDGYLAKVDALGQIQWEDVYGGEDWDFFYDIETLSNQGYLSIGSSFKNGKNRGFVLKTTPFGTFENQLFIEDSTGEIELKQITPGNNKTFWIVGTKTYSDSLNTSNVVLYQLSESLEVLKNFEFDSPYHQEGQGVLLSMTNELYIVGRTNSVNYPIYEGLCLKIDTNGNEKWTSYLGGVYQGSTNQNDMSYDVTQYPNLNVLITGYTKSFGNGQEDSYFTIFDTAGIYVNAPSYGYTGSEISYKGLIDTATGKELFIGSSSSFGTAYADMSLIALDTVDKNLSLTQIIFKDTLDAPTSIEQFSNASKENLAYPNPFSEYVNIDVDKKQVEDVEIQLYSINGGLIYSSNFERSKNGNIKIPTKSFTKGIYFLKAINANTGEVFLTEKLIKQ